MKKECERCEGKELIFSYIKLSYPCSDCLPEKPSWLDPILPPSNELYEKLKEIYTMRNIETLHEALRLECEKLGISLNHHIFYFDTPDEIILKFCLRISNYNS